MNLPLNGKRFPYGRHPKADLIEAYLRMGGEVEVFTHISDSTRQTSYRFVFIGLNLEMQGARYSKPFYAWKSAIMNLYTQLWGEERAAGNVRLLEGALSSGGGVRLMVRDP